MKLQGMSVVFALVIVPIILVLSYYIHMQIDTINLQTEYDTKLLDSTHDAMAAFELNTANEDLSTVSDSLRTIIEASYSVFINNLSTNLGMSNANKSYVEPFIPSVLYTLYDGYYICAPTRVPTVLTDNDGNALSVGDEGVSGSHGNYKYTEGDSTMLGAAVGLDYGQLLYLKDGSTNTYTTDINEAKLEIKNVLKTYMPYSARYKNDAKGFDLTMVYTLDNYATIEGKIGDVYYTKSGYLIPNNSVSILIKNPENGFSTNIDDYNQNDIQNFIENRGADFEVIIDGEDASKINLAKGTTKSNLDSKVNILNNALEDSQELSYSAALNYATAVTAAKSKYTSEYFDYLTSYGVTKVNEDGTPATGDWSDVVSTIASTTDSNEIAKALRKVILAVEAEMRNTQYELDTISSVVYYAKAYTFSKWVDDYLNGKVAEGVVITDSDLIEVSGQTYSVIKGIESLEFDFNTGTNVFNLTGTAPMSTTEIPTDCPFYEHKLNVIRMSIQYNLNLAMSTYNSEESAYKFDYAMPVIKADEWQMILTHISITSFMQGMKCGLKTYNNYKIVSSTNNDILTLPEEVYYVKKELFNNETSDYHRINCDQIINNDTAGQDYIAFGSKAVKYDKISNKNRDFMFYEYDHKNFACYDCINDGNFFNYDSEGTGKLDDRINIFNKHDTNFGTYSNLRRAYYIGVAKERNNTYKMNAINESQGYEVLRMDDQVGGWIASKTSGSLPVNQIKAIELSIGTIYSENDSIRNAIFYFGYDTGGAVATSAEDNLSNDTYSIATNNTSNSNTQSIRINVIPGKLTSSNKFEMSQFLTEYNVKCDNSGDILKVEYDPTTGSRIPDSEVDAVGQFINNVPPTVKYIRLIYK